MPALNKGTSTYHSIHGLYWREQNGTLLAVEGSNSNKIPEAWPQLKQEICSSAGKWSPLDLPSGRQINTLQITLDIPALTQIRSNFPPSYREEELYTEVAEIEHANGLILGLLTSRPKSIAGDAFDTWAERFILLETEFQPFATLSNTALPEHRETCEAVANIFERTIKNVSKDDQWAFGGRDAFLNRVYGYVEKNLPIQLALPAFPCKSPNPNKVGGRMPDLAEHIALDVLRKFVKDVCQVYPPGATMWVISDGHVFSDCIGVDDAMVDTYDKKMAELYKQKFPVEDGPMPAICFKGLQNIFNPESDSFKLFQDAWLAGSAMNHPVKTEITNRAELCRKLMLGIAEADPAFIRQCIEDQEPDALQLYRGQTRFMLEDLADVPSVQKLSNKQKKKTAASVAQEMMSRNQAYSNLVELLLPNYVRLSIHAHNNKGPKFAVRLLPKTLVRPIDDLEHRHEPNPVYEFQLPTPWHNSIIKVEGDELYYLARSQIAKKAMAGKEYKGSWVEDAKGGSHFSLKRITPPTPIRRFAPSLPKIKPVDPVFSLKRMPTVITTPIQPTRRFEPSLVKPKKRKTFNVVEKKGPSVQISEKSISAQPVEKGKWRFIIPMPSTPSPRIATVKKNLRRSFTMAA